MGDMMMNQWMELFFQGEFGTHLPLRPRVGDRSPYSEGARVGWQETTPRSHGQFPWEMYGTFLTARDGRSNC